MPPDWIFAGLLFAIGGVMLAALLSGAAEDIVDAWSTNDDE